MKNNDTHPEVKTSASTLGKISAQKRLGHLSREERAVWGRKLGQVWRDKKEAVEPPSTER